jgi:hypothetical protein
MQFRPFALLAVAAIHLVGSASTAQAGPLIDWLFGGSRRQPPAYPVGAPVPLGNGYGAAPAYSAGYGGYPAVGGIGNGSYATGYPYSAGYPGYASGSYSAGYAPFGMNTQGYAANMGNYYGSQLPVIGPSGAGYTAQMPSGIGAATMPQSMSPQILSYVPNFNSNALRAPVTYYRPLLTTDPNTGSQVVAMAPCTSYQYLTQRVPALGQSALYGTYQAPQPQPMQSMPSYTLPSGGIPIANNAAGSPMINSGTALGYSPYSAYQISPSVPSSVYPTGPISSGYSTPSGGSTGNIYSQSVPGLVAPPTSNFSTPSFPTTPNYSSTPSYPSTPSNPTNSGSVYPPPSTNSFSDPGDVAPSLPPTQTLRPRLQRIVPETTPSGNESAALTRQPERSLLSEPAGRDLPVMNPIPAPEGMEKPSWTPGLLRKEDLNAMRPVTRNHMQLAGQSKKIHWASFENETASTQSGQQPSQLQLEPSSTPGAKETSVKKGQSPITSNKFQPTPSISTSSSQPTAKQYNTGGWKASR